MKRLLLIACALLLALTGVAQTQGRGPVRHTQSDGRILSYVATGTRPNIYAQTLDGYTLWHTATGDIVYAATDSTGQLVPSTVLAADQRAGLWWCDSGRGGAEIGPCRVWFCVKNA